MSIPQAPFKVKTNVSWPGEEEGDLGFLENEIIEVYSIVDLSWWSGKLRRNNAEGIFPKDYVEIMDPQLNHSNSNVALSLSQLHTPVKDAKKNPGPHFNTLPKRLKALNNPDISYDYEGDESFDASFDTIDHSHRYKSNNNPKKSRSANKLMSSMNHPKHKHISHQQQEELLREREREIANFKLIQQQQNYHIKQQQHLEQKKALFQNDLYRNSLGSPLDTYKVKSPKSKSRPQSQLYQPDERGQKSQLYLLEDLKGLKSQSYTEIGAISPQGLFQNHTVESLSPEHFQKNQSRGRRGVSKDELDEYNEISQKRAQLEMELQHLKELEKLTQKRMHQKQKVSSEPHSELSLEGYVSEDLLSSKKNESKDDLGKKLYIEIDDEDDEIDFEAGSPPPLPPKHSTPIKSYNYPQDENLNESHNKRITAIKKVPFDAGDFKISANSQGSRFPLTDEEIFRLSKMQQEELKNSIKSLQSDVLNLSELSATSAGSFMRHKYERDVQQQQELRMQNLSIKDDSPEHTDKNNKDVMESIFQDKKSRHPNIFKKFLGKKGSEEVNAIEKKLVVEQDVDWAKMKMDLNRMNSLTSQDKQARTRRIVREEGSLIVKPLDYVSDINTNETVGDLDSDDLALDVSDIPIQKIDSFMENYDTNSDLNELISDISVKFNSSKISQVRCVLLHLCKFKIIDESSKILTVKPILSEVLQQGEATIYQINYLLKKVLDALRVPSEIVLGFWKKPNEFYHNEQYVINHCWLSVLIENQFLILDTFCFKNGSVSNIRNHPRGFNEYHFLTKPLNIVSTHIPSVIDLQHILPPVDQNIAFHLPRAYSGYYRSNLGFRNFNNALTRLKDLEFFELELNIPVDIELFTLVKTSKVTTNELSLCQIKWINNKRVAKIKALLPENESIGVLQIFAGPKGLQKHFDNIHELAIVIPLYHTGIYKPCKFVPKYPTVQSQNNDLYIKVPQTSRIQAKNSYNFEIEQYPAGGLSSGSGLMNHDFKIVIESPSGKYYKLSKADHSKPFGTYECNIKCQEVGLYRGLVIGDSGNSWYVFGQWDCVAGSPF